MMTTVDIAKQPSNVQIIDFTIKRVVVHSNRSFEEITKVVDEIVGDGEYSVFQELVDSEAAFTEVEETLNRMTGNTGFMKFFMVDLGALLSLMGKPKNARLYLIGNPLIANQMVEHDPGVGLYIPPRVLIYDDYEGETYIAYDQPSTLFDPFQNEFISKVGQNLDKKFSEMAAALS
jgi:uncharacterized protein (DUF302 family)